MTSHVVAGGTVVAEEKAPASPGALVYTTDPLLEALVFPPALRASISPAQQRDLLIPIALVLDIVKLALIKKAIKNKKCKKDPKKPYCKKKKPSGSPLGSPSTNAEVDTELGVQGTENIDEIVLQTFPALVPEVLPETIDDIDTTSLIDRTSATARAKIRFGKAEGDVFFAESKLYRDAKGRPNTIVSGKMRGLPPGKHTIKVHRSGDIRGQCDRVGGVHHEVENLSFIADSQGQAVILFQVSALSLTGDSNVVGRALVLTHQDTGHRTCAVIVRTA